MTLEIALKTGRIINGGKHILFINGDLFSVLKQRMLKRQQNKTTGYQYYDLRVRKAGKTVSGGLKTIHRLIAENFIENIEDLKYINHKDGDKLNNSLSNLEWCTAQQNIRHAVDELGMNRKEVIQMHCDGTIVNVYDSITKATEITGINNISRSISKRHKAGGYKWRYK
jgi:hypothetical protein